MAKQYSREQVIQNPWSEVNAGTDEAIKKLAAYQNLIDAINKSHAALKTEASALKSAIGGGIEGKSIAEIEKINKLYAQSLNLLKQEQKIKSDKAIAEAKLIKMEQDAAQKREENARKRARYEQQELDRAERLRVKAEKLAAAEARKAEAYSRVDGWLKKLSNEHRNLAVRQELGGRLTAEEIKRMQTLEGRIQRYDAALKKVDATQGKHQREVGNYANAWNGLGNSVQQLTRELPAFGNSIQTGFMAISNNLPMFFDEIKKVRTENKALAASGQPTVSALKQIGESIFSLTGILGLSVTALTVFGAEIVKAFEGMIGGASDAALAQKALTETIDAYKSAATEAGTKTREVAASFKLAKEGVLTKEEALKKYNDELGSSLGYAKNLNEAESIFAKKSKAYVEAVALRAQAHALFQKAAEEQANAITAQFDNQIGFFESFEVATDIAFATEEKARKTFDKAQEKGVKDAQKSFRKRAAIFNEEGEKLLRQAELISNEYELELDEETIKSHTKSLKANETQVKSNIDVIQSYIKSLEELDAITKQITDNESKLRLSLIDDEIQSELENIRRKIISGEEYSRDAITSLLNERYDLEVQLAERNFSFKQKIAQKELNEERRQAIQSLIDERNDLIKKVDESEWGAKQKAQDKLKIEADYQLKLSQLNAVFDQNQKAVDAQRILDAQVLTEQLYEIEKESRELSEKVNESIINNEKELLDERLSDLDEYYKNEKIKRLESSMTNEEIAKQELEDQELILQEKIQLLKNAGEETTDLELQLAETRRQINQRELEEKKRYYQELLKLSKKAVDEIFDYQIQDSQRRQKVLDDQINASEQSYDILKSQAAEGNLAAEESLKEQQKITDEYRDRKRAEEERQAALEQAKKYAEMAINITNNLIQQGENPIQAAGKGVGIVQVIKALFGKGFFFGTDDTGSKSPVSDQYGAITGFTHENEQVWSKKDREDVDFATREQLKEAWKLAQSPQMILGTVTTKQDVTHSPITRELIGEVKSMNKKLDNLPNEFFAAEVIDGVLTATHNRIVANTHYKKFNTNA